MASGSYSAVSLPFVVNGNANGNANGNGNGINCRVSQKKAPSVRMMPARKTETPIDKLSSDLSRHLYMPPGDSEALMALMGAVAGSMMEGFPCWLVLTGGPGSGKSELINLLLNLPGVYECVDPTGEQAFLSGTSKKEKAKDATGGLLGQVGMHGALLMNDITSILSKNEDNAKQILAVLRECHSGRWSRPIGGEGGRSIPWEGRLAVFGGCTNEIDKLHALMQTMGARWMYYRMASSEAAEWAKCKSVLSNSAKSAWQAEIRAMARNFFEVLDLRFDGKHGKVAPRRRLTVYEEDRVIRMGQWIARCRSTMSREGYTHDIILPPEKEDASRLVSGFGQLLVGLETIGVAEEKRWKIVGKVAMDSMPASRRIAVDAIRIEMENGEEGATTQEVIDATRMSRKPVERLLQDLDVYGMVVKKESGEGRKARWALTEACRREWELGWGDVNYE